jgi:type IV pilus assembly protein PilB
VDSYDEVNAPQRSPRPAVRTVLPRASSVVTPMSRLGDLLVRRGQIAAAHLDKAMDEQRAHGGALASHLVKLGFINEDALLSYLQKEYRLPVVDPSNLDIPPEVLSLVPATMAAKHQLIPVNLVRSTLTLAMADPSNLVAINEVKFLTGYDVKIAVAGATAVQTAIERYYDAAVNYDQVLNEIGGSSEEVQLVSGEEEVNLQELERATEEAPVVKLVNALLADAIKKHASDVHVEPYEKMLRIRFRMDGVLYEIMQPPIKLKNAITSRIKVMASLDIAERRMPQDGRIKLKLTGNKEMDFRVSVMPTIFGEKVVLRLLDKSNLQLDMTKLGFEERPLADFKDAIYKPHGMVLVTGPTGSGKTTTLYSALAELNKVASNISTAEDPVEFNLVGINQVQIHEDIGLTFAAALRSFLRQDPDIIMVGEIRDFETAEIGVKAALTGHLVLSTLHTNDAPSTVNRLLNMGVEPFLVASSINLIMAQRLVRVICNNCREDAAIPLESLLDIGMPPDLAATTVCYRGAGCSQCSATGYKGRIAIYEVMPMADAIRDAVLAGASSSEIKRAAMDAGMTTLRRSGLNKIAEGVTTVEEVLRITMAD